MSTPPLLPPDDLFRHYRRGLLDQDSLFSQILLTLIEHAELTQALAVLLDSNIDEVSTLSLNVEAIIRHLQLPRLSSARSEANHTGEDDENEPDEDEEDDTGSDASDEPDDGQDPG